MQTVAPSLSVGFGLQIDAVQDRLKALARNGAAFSGAIGGPLVVGVLTPQRNASTLAAKDLSSSFLGLYRQVFNEGFLHGFRGGMRPTIAAVPQFTAIGPCYLATLRETGSPTAALLLASLVESVCTYGPQKRNAQVQFNATRLCASEKVATEPLYRIAGPGFSFHMARNMLAMMGIRTFSPYSYGLVSGLPGVRLLDENSKRITSDLVSSAVAATLSMPFNHIFSWSACTPELKQMGYAQRVQASVRFLVDTYSQRGLSLLGRDLAARISYAALLFTLYHDVEQRLTKFSRSI